MCHELDCENMQYYPTHNIRRYSPNVCPLQVYAALIEVHADDLEGIESTSGDARILTIARIAISSMTFLRECLRQPLTWQMSSITSEGNGSKNSANDSNCHCYLYMICSAIAQVYTVIKCWFNNMSCLGELSDISSLERCT